MQTSTPHKVDLTSIGQQLRSQIASLESSTAHRTQCRVVHNSLVVWKISNLQHHDLLAYFGDGFYLVSALPPSFKDAQRLSFAESLDNQNELIENELEMGRSLITGVDGVVFAGRVHKRLQAVLNTMSTPTEAAATASGTALGLQGTAKLPGGTTASTSLRRDAVHNEAATVALRHDCYSWSSSPLGLHLISSPFEFHISEFYLSPVQLQTAQHVISKLQYLWASDTTALGPTTPVKSPLSLPLVFYVDDDRAEKFQWNLSALDASAFTSDFRKLLYFCLLPAGTDTAMTGTPTEVMTISSPLQCAPLNAPQLSPDLEAVIVCPLQNSAAFQQSGLPWRSAAALLDLCFPPELSATHSDAERSFKVFLRYDTSTEDTTSDCRPASVAARDGPLLSLAATFNCSERKQQHQAPRPSRRGSITNYTTAAANTAGGAQKASVFGEGGHMASSLNLQPALNLCQLLPTQLDTAAVLVRAPPADSSDAALSDMTEDLALCSRLLRHVQQNAHRVQVTNDAAGHNTDAAAWINEFNWSASAPGGTSFDSPDASGYGNNDEDSNSKAADVPQNFKEDVDKFFDEERSRTMAVSSTTAAEAASGLANGIEEGNDTAASVLEQVDQPAAVRALTRGDADFVDRLWQFIRIKVKNYSCFRVLLCGLLNALVPSAYVDAAAPQGTKDAGGPLRRIAASAGADRYTQGATNFKNLPLLPYLRRDSTAVLLKTLVQMATLLGQLEVYGGAANAAERNLMQARWRVARMLFLSPVAQLNLFVEVCLDSLQTDVVHALRQVDSTTLSPGDAPSSAVLRGGAGSVPTRTGGYHSTVETDEESDYAYFLSNGIVTQKEDCVNKLLSVLEDRVSSSKGADQEQLALQQDFADECMADLLRQSHRIEKLSALQTSCEYVLLASKAMLPYEPIRIFVRQVLTHFRKAPVEDRPLLVVPVLGAVGKATVGRWAQNCVPAAVYIQEGQNMLELKRRAEEKENKASPSLFAFKTLVCQDSQIFNVGNKSYMGSRCAKFDVENHRHNLVYYSCCAVERCV